MRYQLVAFLLCGLSANFAHAQWGDLKGRILLDGDVPAVKLLIAGPAPRMPGVANIPDESLVIDAKSKGIANVGVWLVAKKAQKIHPNRAASDAPAVTVNLTQGRFSPHIAVVRTDQTLNYVNLDPVVYNIRGTPLKNQGFNLNLAANAALAPITLKFGERLPVMIGDDVHLWMRSYVIVVDHPYVAVTDKKGKFEIKDLPAGEHEFKVWHERVGWLVKNADNPKKGLIVNIEDGKQMILDDIKVPLKVFEPQK